MKDILIILLIFLFSTSLVYSQKTNVSKEINVVLIDTNNCSNLIVIVFKSGSITKEHETLIIDKKEFEKMNCELIKVNENFVVEIKPIPDFLTNNKYECLTRLGHGVALYIDNVLIWSKQKGVYPYECLKIKLKNK
ncbi:MAG: hypothetical protein WCK92_15945 [Bacteroidota bacterium]